MMHYISYTILSLLSNRAPFSFHSNGKRKTEHDVSYLRE